MKLKNEVIDGLAIILGYFISGHILAHGLNRESMLYSTERFVVVIILSLVIVNILRNKKYGHLISNFEIKGHSTIFNYIVAILYTLFIFYFYGAYRHFGIVISYNIKKIVIIFNLSLTAAIFEELYFRGLLFNIFNRLTNKRIYCLLWSALFSSFFFALIHFVNLSMGQSYIATIQQAIMALTLGIFLSYVRIVFNNLIVPIIIHFFIDFAPIVAKSNPINPWPLVWIFMLIVQVPLILLIIRISKNSQFYD